MSINVYWACVEEEWLRCAEPNKVLKTFYENRNFGKQDKLTGINFCPAFNSSLKNTYTLSSLYKYNFEVDNDSVTTDMYDQKFYDNHVIERSIQEKLFSFTQMIVFFTDVKSLQLTVGQFPFFEDNNITQRCIVLPGTFDIGKWFRPIDFSFYLKNNVNEFRIDEGEIYSYITFHTTDSINLKQFYPSQKIKYFLSDVLLSKQYLTNKFNLENFYACFKTKSQILKEIKKNLL